MADLSALKDAVIKGDQNAAQQITQQALDDGMGPEDILNTGLIAGMNVIGAAFKKNEVYVPEVLIAARAMKMAMEILEPKLVEAGVEPIGTIVIGTVKGDLHDIGKNLVLMMLKGAGFNVVDLGTDVAPEDFVSAIKENNAKAAGLSALLTTTMPMMKDTLDVMRQKYPELVIIIGGAPITDSFSQEINATGYAPDPQGAIELLEKIYAT